MIQLDDIQCDAAGELMNIAIGRAGAALNELVDQEIELSVPEIAFVHRADAGRLIDQRADGRASAFTQEFTGPFSGDAVLIFPEAKSLELVRTIIGDSVPLENMTELEQDALTEVGNIVLNATLGTLADLLELRLTSSLPTFVIGNGDTILGLGQEAERGHEDDLIMFMKVDFALKESRLGGNVMFVLDVCSAKRFAELVDGYIARVAA